MILTLTANPALDLTVFIPKYEPDTTIRANQTFYSMGGKPTDASWILGRMGQPSTAIGFIAGSIGEKVKNLLREWNVTTDFIEVDGETRINTVIIDEASGAQTTITTTSMYVSDDHISQLMTHCGTRLDGASVLITGGSLPKSMSPDFYTQIIKQACDKGIPVIFDAGEPNLSAGLKSQPTYIKPNRAELSALLDETVTTIEQAYSAGRKIFDEYGTQAMITLGKDGALAVLDHCAYRIPSIPIEVQSAAGAGDGVLAGIAYSIFHHQPIEEGIRRGIATATAICLQPGTAVYDLADMERFLPQVELIPYP